MKLCECGDDAIGHEGSCVLCGHLLAEDSGQVPQAPAMIERHYGTLIEGAGADIARRLSVFEAWQEQHVASV